MSNLLEQIKDALASGNTMAVKTLAEQATATFSPETIMNEALIPGMMAVGERFREGDFPIPEVLMASRAMQAGMYVIRPLLEGKYRRTHGKVVIGTVAGDVHDIGKDLVVIMMESRGLEVLDLGVDVPTARFIDAVREHRPDILAMSALLTTTLSAMERTIRALEAESLRHRVKVIVGGGPVTEEFAFEIGADGCSYDAISAADLAVRLIRENGNQLPGNQTGGPN